MKLMTALDLERIRTALADDFTTIDFVEKTGSTNTDLMQATNVADGTVLLADEQLSGKGRLGVLGTLFVDKLSAVDGLALLAELLNTVMFHDFPVAQDYNLVSVALGFVPVIRGEEHGHAGFCVVAKE